jgi:ectoine hydroxylase-related dioxygenase (phytanoyl-CoA dioxygenase family)
MKSIQQRIEEYEENGFTLFENVFSHEQMAQWKRKYEDLVDRQTLPGSEKRTYWLSSVLEYDPWLFLPAVADSAILDFAERVMGPFVQLDNLTFMAFPSMPKEEAAGKTSGWHRDIWAWVPRGDQYFRPLACNAITYFQDMTDEYGPLRVIPGSHRDPVTISREDRLKPHPEEVLIKSKAGDVIFTHCALLHSGTPNTTGNPRYFMSIYYNLTWMHHRDNHAGPSVQKIVQMAKEKNDLRLLRLFGVDNQVFKRANSGFYQADSEMWDQWISEDQAALHI